MQLTETQIANFDREGFLFFPSLFDDDEVKNLKTALPELLEREGPEVVYEPESPETVRLVYGGHNWSDPYRKLSLHPRLLNPVKQLLREDTYLHQSRLNPKQDFGGGVWSWHQDFGTWHKVDGMPEPHCVMTMIFLDDCTAVNAPLLIVPGSQSFGHIDSAKKDTNAKGYALFDIDRATLTKLSEQSPVEALIGPAGSVAFLHCNIVHGSANNISPYSRTVMYFNYNAVSNACTNTERAWHHNNRDFTPLQALEDNCLGK